MEAVADRRESVEDLHRDVKTSLALLIQLASGETHAAVGRCGRTGYEEDAWYRIETMLIAASKKVDAIVAVYERETGRAR